ncbi:hypothetical protein KEM54_001317 [Ascosphaera aggregata]|nr:hypothetical protein KEM54_001317 [Ascosphaera aggregata]
MAKKDKKKSAEAKAARSAKQSKKQEKSEKRRKAKGKDDDSDAEDVDLDAVLAQYAEEQARFLKVTEVVSDPPTPRSSCTLIASPSGKNELFIFGGETFDGTIARFFNNLFVYNVDRHEWREVASPNSPLPRSGHAWCRGGNQGGIYLFGGEFSSPKQGTFYHYNDFWHLNPISREWTRVETKSKGPSARSGHRMTYYKNYILLFGGFQDTSQQTRYLQDLWIYDCQRFTWYNPLPPQKPDARSSFSFLPHESGAVLYGGYSRVKVNSNTSGGRHQKGGGSKVTLKPVIHEDTWFLRITPPPSDAPASTPPAVRWERRKKPANTPSPPRAGVSMAFHKGRGIMFGGVHDVEASEEGIESEFFNALYAWNTDRNRLFPIGLRRPKAGANKKSQTQIQWNRNRSKADEEELLANLARLEAKAKGETLSELEIENLKISRGNHEEEVEKENNANKVLTVRFEMPHPRFNAQLAVLDDTLFIYGGTYERGDQEFTFNDLYSIDLSKLDGCKEIFYQEPGHWNDLLEKDDEEDDDEEEEDDEDEREPSTPITPAPAAQESTSQLDEGEEDEIESGPAVLQDTLPHPRPFESLRDFFSRSVTEWQEVVIKRYHEKGEQVDKTVKELRKNAFQLAEDKWWDCREEIMALEDEQEEAGIGEVVSLADKANTPTVGRRR